MGGYGSGQHSGRPTAEQCHCVELPWLMRTQKVTPGRNRQGSISWTCDGEPSGSIGYESRFEDADDAKLILIYTRTIGETREQVRQEIRLVSTPLHFGGRRWWMVCPYRGERCTKLYLSPWAGRFASRKAWRLNYRSQRDSRDDRPFSKIVRLQRKLGGKALCYDDFPRRPKHMRHQTYWRHWARYEELLDDCEGVFAGHIARIFMRG